MSLAFLWYLHFQRHKSSSPNVHLWNRALWSTHTHSYADTALKVSKGHLTRWRSDYRTRSLPVWFCRARHGDATLKTHKHILSCVFCTVGVGGEFAAKAMLHGKFNTRSALLVPNGALNFISYSPHSLKDIRLLSTWQFLLHFFHRTFPCTLTFMFFVRLVFVLIFRVLHICFCAAFRA